ncbi:MAG: hypothetical protein WBM90_02435, partial [Acidimicrobiia bacterium]
PQPIEGSISMETPSTHLAFARAELSRATGPDPDLWNEAVDRADYIYFRFYAKWRLAEAFFGSGESERGADVLREVHSETTRIGARLMVERVKQTGLIHGVRLDYPAGTTL